MLNPAAMNSERPAHLVRPPMIASLRRWRWVFLAFGSSRVIVWGLIRLSKMLVYPGEFGPQGSVLNVLTRGRGEQIIDIAHYGYSFGPVPPSNVGVFPIYPAIVSAFGAILGNYAIAAVVASTVCLLIAGVLLHELLDNEYHDNRINRAAVVFLMFSPVSFFFSSATAESPFLMFSLAAMLAARRGKWLLASVCGMCLSATNLAGVLIVLPVAFEYLRRFRNQTRHNTPRIYLLALIPCGLLGFLLWSQIMSHHGSAPLRGAELVKGTLPHPGQVGTQLPHPTAFYRYFTALVLGSGTFLWAVGVILRLRASYLLYAAALIIAFACSNDLSSIARHLSVVFPLFITLGILAVRFSWSYELLFLCSVTVLSFCTILAANGHWML